MGRLQGQPETWSASILQTVLYNECWNHFLMLPFHMEHKLDVST